MGEMTNDAVVMFEGTIYENGYGWVAQKVMRDRELHTTAKAIYAYICSMAGNPKNIDERKAFPSVSLMKAELGINSDGTFYKYMNQLKDKGYLKVIQEKDDEGKFKRNIYKIVAVPEPNNDNKKENNRTSKNEVRKEPYSKLPSTDKPSTEKWSNNRNSSTSNSFNRDTKQDTYKDTNLDPIAEQDRLLKESLKDDWLPPKIFNSLSAFSKDFDEMHKWVGIIFRAKKRVEVENNIIINLQDVDYEVSRMFNSAIRVIKKKNNVENEDSYLFKTIYNGLGKLTHEVDDILSLKYWED